MEAEDRMGGGAWQDREAGGDSERRGVPGRCEVACTQHPSRPQCATHKLCHPEELLLLRHSLGISQVSLGGCSSQSLQLVSV